MPKSVLSVPSSFGHGGGSRPGSGHRHSSGGRLHLAGHLDPVLPHHRTVRGAPSISQMAHAVFIYVEVGTSSLLP